MARRARRRSFGSVTEVRKGKKYVIRWVQNTPEGRKRKSKTIYGTYKEACRELALREVEHGEERRMPTWGEVYEMWYRPWLERRHASGELASNSLRMYLGTWDRIAPRMASRPTDGVSPLEFQRLLLDLPGSVASQAVVVVRRMCRFALDYTGSDPLFGDGRRYELPKRQARPRDRVVSSSEALEMMSALRGSPNEAAFLLACFGGLRTGETLAVRAERVERVERSGRTFAAVDVTCQMPAQGIEPTDRLKNPQSRRVAVIPPVAAGRLLELAVASESGWIADRGDGLPLARKPFDDRWKVDLRRRDVEYVPFSCLRNSWRTMAETEVRMPWDLAETLMGHKLPGVTGRHYIRSSREQIVSWACDALLGSIWDI